MRAMRRIAILSAVTVLALSLALALVGCMGAASSRPQDFVPSDDELEAQTPSDSGPVAAPMEEEPSVIREAPRHDVEEAASYIDAMPDVRALVDSIDGDAKDLIEFGNAHASAKVLDELRNEIDALSEGNHKVSLIMVDLKTQSGVAYQPSLPMPTQSTVKAIYAGALVESYPDVVERNGQYMRDALEFSENEPYKNLRRIYGITPMVKWCEEAGVNPDFAKSNFPRTYTACDMFKLWTKMYCFLNDGTDKDNIGAYLADSSASATRKQLGDRFVVQTKAGWEGGLDEDHNFDPNEKPPAEYADGDPSNDEVAINDTGIVYTDKGPYLFVIYTNHPFGVYRDYTDVNPLYGLVEALNKVQQDL